MRSWIGDLMVDAKLKDALLLWLFPLLHALSGGEGRERRAFKYCVCF
jgi:hypothetical protein